MKHQNLHLKHPNGHLKHQSRHLKHHTWQDISRIGTISAGYKQNIAKHKENQRKSRFGKGWTGLDGVGPAECAMAAYFASRKQIRLLTSAVSFCLPTRLSPQEGLAVFNRSAHSARPSHRQWKWEMGDRKWEIGNGKWEKGKGKWRKPTLAEHLMIV